MNRVDFAKNTFEFCVCAMWAFMGFVVITWIGFQMDAKKLEQRQIKAYNESVAKMEATLKRGFK